MFESVKSRFINTVIVAGVSVLRVIGSHDIWWQWWDLFAS